jgi:hypothetical protein
MDAAIRNEWIFETDVIAYTMPVDENHHVAPQMALLVKYVAAQPRIYRKRCFQRIAQRRGRSIDFRQFGEASQLLGKDNLRHGENYLIFDLRDCRALFIRPYSLLQDITSWYLFLANWIY